MMEKIRTAALEVEPGGHVWLEGRKEVIDTVEKGIVEADQGLCLKDFGGDGPRFDPKRGEYVSELRIFPNAATKNDWVDRY